MAREIKWTKGSSIYNPTLAATGQAYLDIIRSINQQITDKETAKTNLRNEVIKLTGEIQTHETNIATYNQNISDAEHSRSRCYQDYKLDYKAKQCHDDYTDTINKRTASRNAEFGYKKAKEDRIIDITNKIIPSLDTDILDLRIALRAEEKANIDDLEEGQNRTNSQILANKGIVPQAEIEKARILAQAKKEADLKLAQAMQDKVNAEIATTNRSKKFQRIVIITVIMLLIAGGAYYYFKGRKA